MGSGQGVLKRVIRHELLAARVANFLGKLSTEVFLLLFFSNWSMKQILVMCRKLFGQIRSPIALSKWWVFLQRVERPKTTTTTSPWPTRPTSTCSQPTPRFVPINIWSSSQKNISLSEEADAAEDSDLLFFKRRPLVLRTQCHHCFGTGCHHHSPSLFVLFFVCFGCSM